MVVMIELIINAIFTGLGTAIGSYLGQRGITKKLDSFLDRLGNKMKKRKMVKK